jgi:hypothetical protein
MCLCVGREIFSVLVLITQPRTVVRSARLSVMISHKAGQADPPKVISCVLLRSWHCVMLQRGIF